MYLKYIRIFDERLAFLKLLICFPWYIVSGFYKSFKTSKMGSLI